MRRVFEVAKENDVHEIAFSVIHTEKKGFPADLAAHICIRTLLSYFVCVVFSWL